jgi:hypothetical protein
MSSFIFAIFCSIVALAYGRDLLGPGDTMENGETLLSADGRFRLLVQDDGDLVMLNYREGGKIQWRAETAGSGAIAALMLQNGVFCLANKRGELVYQTRTFDAGSYVRMQNNGNLVMYNPNGYTPWSSAYGYVN